MRGAREDESGMSFDHHDPHFVEDPASVFRPILEDEPLVHS